jgi:hypothetical protein
VLFYQRSSRRLNYFQQDSQATRREQSQASLAR